MKKIGLIIAFLTIISGGSELSAQQLPQFSQYMLNPYLINPAVAGTTDHYDLKVGGRRQWSGITDTDANGNTVDVAPQTIYVTGHGHIGKDHERLRGKHKNQNSWHHGLGFQVIADKTGPTSLNSFKLTYAYDMNITKGTRISFGVSGGLSQWALNGNLIRLSDGSTGVGSYNVKDLNRILPDLSVGIWVYHKLYYFGAAADQLIMASLGDKNYYYTPPGATTGTALNLNGNNLVNRLTQHYFITGGGIFHPTRMIAVIPSVLLKSTYNNPGKMSLDMNVKVRYNNFVWGGLSYRTGGVGGSDAFVALVGMLINDKVEVGYAFDYTIGALNTTGFLTSHELMVGLRINPRAHILSPSDFW